MLNDQAQRERAIDPGRSFIVQAPAGSGKTGLLVHRFLRLLATAERPEAVVAMTFTRKAAAEMQERVYEALQDADKRNEPAREDYRARTHALAREALAQDRRKRWNLLADPSRLQIQTIDSLCALLTRQMPVLSGFGGELNVVEDATDLYRLAARQCLHALADGAEPERALLMRIGLWFDNDFSALQGQIVEMLRQRDQWRLAERFSNAEVADFCSLLTAADRALEEVFRARGTVDFTAVTRAAIAVLGSSAQPSDLLYALDYRIQHLLVDEFQDTSVAQYELINALTAQWSAGDEHTLFVVGDPMQSIYGFRGAEVSLFLETWHRCAMESVELERVELKTNFRTTPEISAWTEEHFKVIMPEDADGGVRFRASEAARPAGGDRPQLIPFIADSGSREAAAVAEIARAALERGSVAILVRSRTHLTSILPALRRYELPYEAVEIDKLGEQQHILDLVSLTRAMLHAGDRVAWLACLRAPWCGLTLADLSALAEGERGRTILGLLSDSDRIRKLSPEGRKRAVRAAEILLAATDRAGRLPLRTLLEDTWTLLGGPALLSDKHQHEDVETYLNLVERLEDGGAIRDLSALTEGLECLYARPDTGKQHIQLLTIHKAKGLEFDTVILPHLQATTRSNERELLIWNESVDENGAAHLQIAAQPRRAETSDVYKAIQEAQAKREDNELKRLFYVACTRAKNELYLLASTGVKKDGELSKARSGTFLRLIWEQVLPEFEGVLRRSPHSGELFEDQEAAPATILRRLPATWRLPRTEPSVIWRSPWDEITASARQITYEWVSDTGRHVGTVVHALLKQAAQTRLPRDTALEALVRSELLRLGVPKREEDEAAGRVKRALENTLGSERGQWILAPHREARSEWALGGAVGNQLISGTVDRMFRDDEGRLWIIDYKTSEHQGAQLERFLTQEQKRYRTQLEGYAALMSTQTSAPIWLGLYFPLLDGWRAWQYAEQLALSGNYTGS